MGPHLRSEVVSTIAGLGWTAAIVAIPALAGEAVNRGILGHHWHQLAWLGAAIAVLGVVQAVCSAMRRYFNGKASRYVEAELRREFFTRLLGYEVGYHDQVNRGQLLSRVTSDLFQIQQFIAALPWVVANLVTVVAVAIILLVVNPLLGILAVAGLPVVAITSGRYARAVRPVLGALQAERGGLAGVVDESLSGMSSVKGFGAEPALADRLGQSADGVRARSLDIVAIRCRYNPALNVVPLVELAAVNWLGGYLVLHHQLNVGMLLAYNAYLATVTGPLQSVGWFIVQAERALVSALRLDAVMRRTPEIREPDAPRPLPASPGSPGAAPEGPVRDDSAPEGLGRVRFDRVRFSYPGAESPVLDDFSLDIPGGQVVALVGATGSGKSTIVSLVARLYDPDDGSVTIDGVDVRDLALATLRGAVGVVFEESFLFDDTIEANLRIGGVEASEEQLRAAARIAQADDFIEQLDDGYSSFVGERGLSLSGGQRQRLALARGVLADPRVLVLDDATSAVDAERERQIVKGLEALSGSRTIIIVSHRAATIALADRVVMIERGAVAAVGTHEELHESSEAYRQLLGDRERAHVGLDRGRHDA